MGVLCDFSAAKES
ncbi:hypothetical protein WJX82_005834 [Trebouxia sp. C0006]